MKQQCINCAKEVGTPFDGGGQDFTLSDKPAVCICVQCCTVMWIQKGVPPKPMPNKELFQLILLRPSEMLHMLSVTIAINRKLESGKN